MLIGKPPSFIITGIWHICITRGIHTSGLSEPFESQALTNISRPVKLLDVFIIRFSRFHTRFLSRIAKLRISQIILPFYSCAPFRKTSFGSTKDNRCVDIMWNYKNLLAEAWITGTDAILVQNLSSIFLSRTSCIPFHFNNSMRCQLCIICKWF